MGQDPRRRHHRLHRRHQPRLTVSKFALLWYWREGRLDDRWWKVASFADDTYPKSTTVVGGVCPTTVAPFSWTDLDDAGRLVVGMVDNHLPDAPNLWWVLHDEPHRLVHTQSLIAFADGRYPDGTVLTVAQVRADVLRDDAPLPAQAGAVRWGHGDPKLEQLYVAPEFRRRREESSEVHPLCRSEEHTSELQSH